MQDDGPVAVAETPEVLTLQVASFNIQFLGHFRNRDDAALAALLEPYDLVFVQELVAPPYAGVFPNGEAFRPDVEAARFFDAMAELGFTWMMSAEDSGSGPRLHDNGPATEWAVVFYREANLEPAEDLFTGYIAAERAGHPDFDRVPHAFAFRACLDRMMRACSEDLVFISVHLRPGRGQVDTARRAHEIASITAWIEAQEGSERDYVILGDMNIEDCAELADVLPEGYVSLNDECAPTNTNPRGPKPYDHVMIRAAETAAEIPPDIFVVIDLIEAMRASWDTSAGPYPGDPYVHNAFRQRYSDHHPVAFELVVDGHDDD